MGTRAAGTPTSVNKNAETLGRWRWIVDCNATGQVTKEERHSATKIMDRIMEHMPKEHG